MSTAVPKQLENIAVSPSRCNDLETANHSSEVTGKTRDLKHLEDQAPVVIPLSVADASKEQTLPDISGDIESDDEFIDTGVCANCNRQTEKGAELMRCAYCHITRYCDFTC